MSMSRHILLSLLGLLFIIVLAKCSITLPITLEGIPITGQSFAVLAVAYLFGIRYGSAIVGVYILLGVLGLPVFSGQVTGIETLLKASGGFIYGFLASTILTNLAFNKQDSSFNTILQFMLFGTALILLFGGLHMLYFYDLNTVISRGIIPFLPGAMIKILLGAIFVKVLTSKLNTTFPIR